MLFALLAALLVVTPATADTVVVLRRMERDLTGDGKPEVLRLIGIGESLDSLDVTFSITSREGLLYQTDLWPLTRHVGGYYGRARVSLVEHRARLKAFGRWFFGESKFTSPEGFVEQLREQGPRHIPLIPAVIAKDRRHWQLLDSLLAAGENPPANRRWSPWLADCWRTPCDVARADSIWKEIQNAGVTVFTFSPGGDRVMAIAWSERDRRFYELWECC